MQRFVFFLLFFLLLGAAVAGAATPLEGPQQCTVCGMDRTVLAQSRMVITYADGTTVGVCSIRCSVVEMQKNRDKRVASLQVADYPTRQLTDARTATWVVGGKKEGVMTSRAKWAFARQEDAQGFVREFGGEVTPFEQVLQLAQQEVAEEPAGGHEHHGPGGTLLFNPAFGDDIYHTHPAGMGMVNLKLMSMTMSGLRAGTTNVSVNEVIPMNGSRYGYMMAPTRMTMNMYMLMGMYGVTDRFTVMGTLTLVTNEMEMLMNMGMGKGNVPEPPMRSSGIGDTELRAAYQISKTLVGSLGLGIPTGAIDKDFTTMKRQYRAPYDMQLGSGTVNLTPALTYNALSDDGKWNWGSQASYLFHLGKNDNHWSFGDTFKASAWLQRALGPASAWLRLAFNNTKHLRGQDPAIELLLDPNPMKGASMPDADPSNYGGNRLDGFIGTSFTAGPFSIGVEGGMPFYQNLNGLQLKTEWYITAAAQLML